MPDLIWVWYKKCYCILEDCMIANSGCLLPCVHLSLDVCMIICENFISSLTIEAIIMWRCPSKNAALFHCSPIFYIRITTDFNCQRLLVLF